jgi:hypothetical protein
MGQHMLSQFALVLLLGALFGLFAKKRQEMIG